MTYAVATTVRRRRADLAVLRVLGMTTSQLRSVVTVQVLALSLVGATIGTVLGALAGRQIWRLIVDSLSLPFSPAMPLAALIAVPGAALLLTHLAATLSRRTAGRIPAAAVLRTE